MKKLGILLFSVLFFSVVNSNHAFSSEKKEDSSSKATSAFDQIKSLAGTWQGVEMKDNKKESFTVVDRVTSGGTAFEETLFSKGPHEMVSVYFMDRDDLKMTHYCMLGNQPTLKLTFRDKDKMVFNMVSFTGMKNRRQAHMGQLTITWKDPKHITERWVGYENNREKKVAEFQLSKK